MVLKEIESFINGDQTFKLLLKNELGQMVEVDEIQLNEIHYLPASLTTKQVLHIDLNENKILLDGLIFTNVEKVQAKQNIDIIEEEI